VNSKPRSLTYQPGERPGLKGVTFRVEGEYAYGLLSAEAGVHRLVAHLFLLIRRRAVTLLLLPCCLSGDRRTSKSGINEKDLRIDTCRATGAGGQHINTTDSAVRITQSPRHRGQCQTSDLTSKQSRRDAGLRSVC